jgi:hypothetical protein
MKRIYPLLFIVIATFSGLASIAHAKEIIPTKKPPFRQTHIVGYLEKVRVPHVDVVFRAKLDTGADTSSMHAEIIDLKKPKETEDGKGYVVFTLDSDQKKSNHIKKPLARIVRIKLRGGGYQRRPVVKMEFCIAGIVVHEEVNLTNRENFKYDLLVGRNMLAKGGFLIDSEATYTSTPNCAQEEEESSSALLLPRA